MIEISVNEDDVIVLVEIITSYNIFFFVNFLQKDGFFSIFADKNEKIYYESQFIEDVKKQGGYQPP